MILFWNCCMRYKWSSFYEIIWIYLSKNLVNIFTFELFGNKKVKYSYNNVNDLMYLDTKLRIIKNDMLNETFAQEYGHEPKTFDEEICEEKTMKWFFRKGANIRKVFLLLN